MLPSRGRWGEGSTSATVTDSARGVVEIRSRQQSPVLATIGRYPARPAPARCRERRRLTPAVPGGVSASCLARSLETAYQKTGVEVRGLLGGQLSERTRGDGRAKSVRGIKEESRPLLPVALGVPLKPAKDFTEGWQRKPKPVIST